MLPGKYCGIIPSQKIQRESGVWDGSRWNDTVTGTRWVKKKFVDGQQGRHGLSTTGHGLREAPSKGRHCLTRQDGWEGVDYKHLSSWAHLPLLSRTLDMPGKTEHYTEETQKEIHT